jgi:hypothetical protein
MVNGVYLMQKVRIFLLLMGLCWFSGQGAFLYAQEEQEENAGVYAQEKQKENAEEEGEEEDFPDGDISIETDWDGYMTELYSRGDQTFTISVGVIFPTVFHDKKLAKITHNFFPVGGAGSLAYTHFLNAHFFLGGEIGVNFNYTLGENTIFIVPIGIRTGWQFVFRRFEFPLTLAIGIAPERYLNFNYMGMFIKLGASGFFRFSPEWSFGLNTDWNWYPQWPQEDKKRAPDKDIYANIIGVTFAARYHF